MFQPALGQLCGELGVTFASPFVVCGQVRTGFSWIMHHSIKSDHFLDPTCVILESNYNDLYSRLCTTY